MKANTPLTVSVASYISSEDASSDLKVLDDLYWTAAVDGYDAALLVTDAWNQVRVVARSGRQLSDLSIGSLHEASMALFGGPFLAGKLPTPPPDQRISEDAMRQLALALPAASVLIIAIGDVALPGRAREAFTRAEWVQVETVDRLESPNADLRPIIANLIGEGAAGSGVGTK